MQFSLEVLRGPCATYFHIHKDKCFIFNVSETFHVVLAPSAPSKRKQKL